MNCFAHVHSGGVFDILNPRPEDIHIKDIAHALSFRVRFNGHVKFFYTVGQHSVLVADLVAERHGQGLALAALLHDAPECFIPDVISPQKGLLYFASGLHGFESFSLVESGIMKAVAERFALPWPLPSEIKTVDTEILAAEREQVLSDTDRTKWRELPPAPRIKIQEMKPENVRAMFLARFEEWGGKTSCA